ncbi:MAG: hypothetical protein K2J10_12690, partial [Muribaculaceae bacterium]|nr:hypothetical protein [Muribaculaceae bacterium]
ETQQPETYPIIDTDFSQIMTSGTIDKPQKELEMSFDGDWFANMPVLAEGMIGINNQDIDFFGQAYLQSPVIDLSSCQGEITISFTAFSRKNLKNACVKLCDHSPSLSFVDTQDFQVSETPETYSFTLSGGSSTSSLLITSEEEGMMFIDDLKVTVNLPANASIVLPVHTFITPETSLEISRADLPSEDQIAYYVRASWAVSHKDGEVRQIPEVISAPSNYVWVEQNASVEDIVSDTAKCFVSVSDCNINIINPNRLPILVYNTSGRCISSISSPTTSSTITVTPGLYIVRVGSYVYKLSVGRYF